MRVGAVLVNYNSGTELKAALQSIADSLVDEPWEATVVDNASADGSAEIATRFGARVRLLRNTENTGFGRGVNQGARATTAPLLLIMNPDCRLTPGALETLRDQLIRYPSCAVVGPQVLNPDGSLQGSARGDPDMLTGLFGRTGPLRRWLPASTLAARNVVVDEAVRSRKPSVAVDWVAGACMLVRHDAFDAVGGFDEGYFMYWEDADLCRRLRARGYHVRYVPGATAIHRVGVSSQSVRAESVRWFHDSAYRYYATHVAPGAFDPRRPIARWLLSVRCRHALKG